MRLSFNIGKYRITVNLGVVLALVMAYQLWGWKGTLFTAGLIAAN